MLSLFIDYIYVLRKLNDAVDSFKLTHYETKA